MRFQSRLIPRKDRGHRIVYIYIRNNVRVRALKREDYFVADREIVGVTVIARTRKFYRSGGAYLSIAHRDRTLQLRQNLRLH